ncbi:hypothetical protein K470DRAFT_95959 [Piedraia hortae CBS 480.64]|uniref:Uncharacterized protein n=1 Tax=Piedraia hortae CBS 480.64 TaxID=1314780 RepID=A0A6A7BW19_9PEZI|nr:hypothetical protein K470DRAFT_95959 [Piedraia hortae CBS 480.64]
MGDHTRSCRNICESHGNPSKDDLRSLTPRIKSFDSPLEPDELRSEAINHGIALHPCPNSHKMVGGGLHLEVVVALVPSVQELMLNWETPAPYFVTKARARCGFVMNFTNPGARRSAFSATRLTSDSGKALRIVCSGTHRIVSSATSGKPFKVLLMRKDGARFGRWTHAVYCTYDTSISVDFTATW